MFRNLLENCRLVQGSKRMDIELSLELPAETLMAAVVAFEVGPDGASTVKKKGISD